MQIGIGTDSVWNKKRLSLVEHPGGMGDKVQVCIHDEGDEPEYGTTVKVFASDLIRAAKMLSVPYGTDDLTDEASGG